MNGDSIKKSDSIKKLPFTSKTRTTFVKNKNTLGFNDEDDDEEDDQIQEVKSFEDNKVTELYPKAVEALPTIAPIANADWRALAKQNRQRYTPTQTHQSSTSTNQEPEILAQSATSYGLQVPTKKTETTASNTIEINQSIDTTTSNITTAQEEKEEISKTLETQAIEAIIRESKQTEEDNENEALVIPMNETDIVRNDIKDRAEDITMEDYENMPVEEFGAALLRGLGWKKGEGIGRNRKHTTPPAMTPIKQRESLLGLGAKPQDADKDSDKKNDSKGSQKKSQYEYKESSLFKKITKRRAEEESSDRYDRSSSSSPSSSSSSSSNRDYRKYKDEKSSSSSNRGRKDHSNERRSSSSSRDRSRDRRERREYSEKNRSSSSSKYRDDKYYSKTSSSSKRSRSRSPRRDSSGRSSKYYSSN